MSRIVDLLSTLPDEELLSLRDKTRDDLARLRVELEQIEDALAKRRPRPRGRAKGDTRRRVIEYIEAKGKAASPSEVHAALDEDGPTPGAGAIHNMLGRLVKEGELAREGDGLYNLASRAAPSEGRLSGFSENGGDRQLSAGLNPHKAARQDA